MKISEIIADKYKLDMSTTVYHELMADVLEVEEEQEHCEDAISRKEALNAFYEATKITSLSDDYLEVTKRLIEILPPVQPKVKTGHWIYIFNSIVNGLKIVKCSECGKRTYGSGKYCPNCGCYMGEPQESEDTE